LSIRAGAKGSASQPLSRRGNQAMAPEAYHADGVKRLEDMGVHEVMVEFRDAYAGGDDNRTLDQMLAEIDTFAEDVIVKSRR